MIFAQLLIKAIYNIFFHPLRDYPGPLLWRASPFMKKYSSFMGIYHITVPPLHAKYGDVVRIAPNEISYTHREPPFPSRRSGK